LNDSDKNGEDVKVSVASRTEFPTEFGSADGVRALINGLAESGRVRSSRELRLIALAGQQAQVQIGANKPTVTGVAVTSLGRTNSLTFKSLGTTVRATPYLDVEKRIQIALEYSMSDMEPTNDSPIFETSDGKSKVVAEKEIVHQVQTTAKLKNGAAVMVKCDVYNNTGEKTPSRQTDLLILGCETVPAPE
jgi:type II secretory pathway component GspD/PulD (secretin)